MAEREISLSAIPLLQRRFSICYPRGRRLNILHRCVSQIRWQDPPRNYCRLSYQSVQKRDPVVGKRRRRLHEGDRHPGSEYSYHSG